MGWAGIGHDGGVRRTATTAPSAVQQCCGAAQCSARLPGSGSARAHLLPRTCRRSWCCLPRRSVRSWKGLSCVSGSCCSLGAPPWNSLHARAPHAATGRGWWRQRAARRAGLGPRWQARAGVAAARACWLQRATRPHLGTCRKSGTGRALNTGSSAFACVGAGAAQRASGAPRPAAHVPHPRTARNPGASREQAGPRARTRSGWPSAAACTCALASCVRLRVRSSGDLGTVRLMRGRLGRPSCAGGSATMRACGGRVGGWSPAHARWLRSNTAVNTGCNNRAPLLHHMTRQHPALQVASPLSPPFYSQPRRAPGGPGSTG